MAPKRKMGTRMDAAMDSMSPYGFPKKLVRQSVHHLLKVYGGSDGWVFIEDSAYSLLIETLLEKQQQQQQRASASAEPNVAMIEDNPGDAHSETPPAGSLNRVLLPCSNTETFVDSSLTNQAIDTVSATSETCIQLPIKPVDTLSPASETSKQPPIKAVNTVSATCETDCKPDENFAVGIHETPLACSPLRTKLPKPVERLCHQRRKPCFGWISDDDEEEEPIELPQAPLCLN